MMAFNFKPPCAVTYSITSFRGAGQGKNNNNEQRNYPKGQINNFAVTLLFFFVGTHTCQSFGLFIGLLEQRDTPGFYCHLGKS